MEKKAERYKAAIDLGEEVGFSNLISVLKRAWIRKCIRVGCTERNSILAAETKIKACTENEINKILGE